MNRWFFLGGLMAGLLSAGRAAESGMRASTPELRKEIVAVIEGQLAAFRADELQKAYALASTALRAQTPLRQFLRIVETSYPEIRANVRAEFGLVRNDGGHATVVVQVDAKEGSASYDYGLVKERDGWRIESVLRHAPKPAEKV